MFAAANQDDQAGAGKGAQQRGPAAGAPAYGSGAAYAQPNGSPYWLAPQFQQFSLQPYPHSGATYYVQQQAGAGGGPHELGGPPGGTPHGAGAALPHHGGHHHAHQQAQHMSHLVAQQQQAAQQAQAQQQFLGAPLPQGGPPDGAPRGWGGVQLQQQHDPRCAGRGGRNPHPRSGRRGGRAGGRGGRGGGRRGGGYAADGSVGEGPEELLCRIKRLGPQESVEEVAAAGLRSLDSRATAALLKELGRAGLARRAWAIFDLLRGLGPGHELAPLADEFTYTSMITNCEMRGRGIQRNVHTFSALMNVCIKCGQYRLALDVYREMRGEGCPANVVTYNTLIDVYGKSGQWEEALGVLDQMQLEGCHPVTRTYNTLMIACNTSAQWQEALRVHEEMVRAGHAPNTTTYNALISAHSRAGDLPRVLAVFREMGCERSVITYSSLISACEKAYERGGQWRRALDAFEAMCARGCAPDAIVYNAIIDVLWETGVGWAQRRALGIFRQASADGLLRRCCHLGAGSAELNLHSTTAAVALLSLHCWLADLAAQVAAGGPGALPERISIVAGKGVTALLRSLRAPFKESADSTPAIGRLEAGGAQVGEWLAADSAAILAAIVPPAQPLAVAAAGGSAAAPGAGAAAAAAGGGSDAASDASSVSSGGEGPLGGTLAAGSAGSSSDGSAAEGGGAEPAAPPAGPAAPGVAAAGAAPAAGAAEGSEEALAEELATEARVVEAFNTVKYFEETHCLDLQARFLPVHKENCAMGDPYLQQRPELIGLAAGIGRQLALPEEAVYDAVLLLDRAMSVSLELADGLLGVAMAACLQARGGGALGRRQGGHRHGAARGGVAAGQCGLPEGLAPSVADVAQVTGLLPELLARARSKVVAALGSDTAAISALRCLKLYLERIGGDVGGGAAMGADGAGATEGGTVEASGAAAGAAGAGAGGKAARSARGAFGLLHQTLQDGEFLNYRRGYFMPSVVAAAVLYADRRSRGAAPYWPSALARLTGYAPAATPELGSAVAGAQRLLGRLQAPAALWNHAKPGGAPAHGGAAAAAGAGTAAPACAAVGDTPPAAASPPPAAASLAPPQTVELERAQSSGSAAAAAAAAVGSNGVPTHAPLLAAPSL
eukprot:scaffold24.g2940.t1